MWYSSRDDVNRSWVQPSKDTPTDRRGIRPSMDTLTYRHRNVGYGHSPKFDHVLGVQHRFITPRQCRHVNLTRIVMHYATCVLCMAYLVLWFEWLTAYYQIGFYCLNLWSWILLHFTMCRALLALTCYYLFCCLITPRLDLQCVI